MKYYGDLNMGEGMAGPCPIALCTTAIFSCMGIAMVNSQSGMAGMYHYPANRASDEQVCGTLRQMLNDIEPSLVVITPAAAIEGSYTGSTPVDVAAIFAFIQGVTRKQPQVYASEHLACLIVRAPNDVTFNIPPPQLGRDVVQIIQDVRTRYDPEGRYVAGNLMYYGRDREQPEQPPIDYSGHVY
ncbi:MAG: hypothetical protein ACI835_005291 [Planctomycetota bacterium]|jgi:hypothetical protein